MMKAGIFSLTISTPIRNHKITPIPRATSIATGAGHSC